MGGMWESGRSWLNDPVDAAALGFARCWIAAFTLWRVLEFCLTGKITTDVIEAGVFFKYPLTEWLPNLSGMLPYAFFPVLAILAAAVLVGWRTFVTTKLLALGLTYWFLLDATAYSDPFYLLVLLSIALAWLPVNGWLSADRASGRQPTATVPAWTLTMLRLQLVLVFLFHGLGLLNSDWLHAMPVREWLAVAPESPLRDWGLAHPAMLERACLAYAVSQIVFAGALCWPRAARFVVPVVALALLLDAFWTQLSPAPLLLCGLLVIFYQPDLPRRVLARLAFLGQVPPLPAVWSVLRMAGRMIDRAIAWFDDTPVLGAPVPLAVTPVRPPDTFVLTEPRVYIAMALLLVQVLLPLRNLWPNTNDTYAARSRFSWCGQTREINGRLELALEIPSRDVRWELEPAGDFPVPLAVLYSRQELESRRLEEGALRDLAQGAPETFARRLEAMKLQPAEADRILLATELLTTLRMDDAHARALVSDPDFLRQYTHEVRRTVESLIQAPVTLHARLNRSVNFRPFQLSLDPEMNLAAIESAADLDERLFSLKMQRPDETTLLAMARDLQSDKMQDWEADVIAGKTQLKEAIKAPGFSDEDEAWFQSQFPPLQN